MSADEVTCSSPDLILELLHFCDDDGVLLVAVVTAV
jgi:hypothetical protein